ncbi:GON-4-like protein [Eleginops maclovinus]|uniref:GON-4-like protein n=1 Tax=Eleginops maclovinus TaxID=56733 RepID=UPI003080BA22
MNLVRKRLRLSPSKPQGPSTRSLRAPPCSHDALQQSPAARGGEGEMEEEGYLLVEEDTTDSSLIITMEESPVEVKAVRRKSVKKRKKKQTEEEEDRGGASESEEEEPVEIDRQLDQSLETKSKQHNLTTVNVRNIIHEVITNEHVVAMMKAAINDTEAIPAFEPKMTRAKFKEVVEKGVVIPAWNLSPIKKTSDINKAPQFVDIQLAEEDSSDEEYRPDEEEEDETAEDTLLESDMESTASSPRGSRLSRGEEESCSPWQVSRSRSRCRRGASVSMGPPPPPRVPPPRVTDSLFLEKLHAVEEELAVCMEPFQTLAEAEGSGLMACRTRSKRTLRDVPLGRLEAELRAPDITPDMYDCSSAPEDREWTDWLRGLMTSDMENEEECDDEDDPEYNFLSDIDEPDVEDYRDDKAVRITKKEVNELMEELFETLKEDLAGQEVEDEGHEEEEGPVHTHTPEEQHNTGSADGEQEDRPITELRTVKQQLALIRKKRQLGLHAHTHCDTHSGTHSGTHTHCTEPHTLKLSVQQRSRLQQQLTQHVQLLTQIQLLSSPVPLLQSEADTCRHFLLELELLAQRGELLLSAGRPSFCSVFRASNLRGALQLLQEAANTPVTLLQEKQPDARGYMRCFPVLPAQLAWIFATRPVFLYPELLPCASLDPALYCPRRTAAFTEAEDCLLVLGLRNMEGSCDPPKLVSQFLLRKTLVQVRRRILQCCRPGAPDNIVKAFRYQHLLWPMLQPCRGGHPAECPPVEKEEKRMPLWLLRSLPVLYPPIRDYNRPPGSAPKSPPPRRSGGLHMTYSFPPGTRYPQHLPKHLLFRRIGFVRQQPPRLPPSSPPPSSTLSMPTRERIRCHYQTLCSLRDLAPPPPAGPAPSQDEEGDDVIRTDSEEEEEESDVLLMLSESDTEQEVTSPEPPPPPPPAGLTPLLFLTRMDEYYGLVRPPVLITALIIFQLCVLPVQVCVTVCSSCAGVCYCVFFLCRCVLLCVLPVQVCVTVCVLPVQVCVTVCSSCAGVCYCVFFLCRCVLLCVLPVQVCVTVCVLPVQVCVTVCSSCAGVCYCVCVLPVQVCVTVCSSCAGVCYCVCVLPVQVCDALQASPPLCERLLQVLDGFSPPSSAVCLYGELRGVLGAWPQLLRDFAAFLSQSQARSCGLLVEQQLFERSRRFLQRLGRGLGEGSAPYQQVVSALQGSSAPLPEDMEQISSLLGCHADLHKEFREFFQRRHGRASPVETDSQNPPLDGDRKRDERTEEAESGRPEEEAESERPEEEAESERPEEEESWRPEGEAGSGRSEEEESERPEEEESWRPEGEAGSGRSEEEEESGRPEGEESERPEEDWGCLFC